MEAGLSRNEPLSVDDASLIGLFVDLVRIDSESGEEGPFIDFVADLFSSHLEGQCRLDSFGNLICRVPPRSSTESVPILLSAHADTVRPGKGIMPVVADAVIRSSGLTVLGADDKAGILEILVALALAERRPPVEVLITREEESGLQGVRHLDDDSLEAKLGFVVDLQALDRIVIGGPRHYFLDVVLAGRAAHAGVRPEQGISAIKTAALAIAGMPDGRIDAETTCNLGVISGGVARNVVPESVKILAECRSLADSKADDLAALIENGFREAAKKTGATVDVAKRLEYSSYHIPEDALPARIARQALEANGLTAKLFETTGSTDAVFLNAKGIETVVVGFGGRNAHTKEEQIALADIRTAIGNVRRMVEALA